MTDPVEPPEVVLWTTEEFARAALDAQRPPEGDRSGRAGSARLNPDTTPAEEPEPVTDPVEPPEVTDWNEAAHLESQTGAFSMMRAGDALAAALVAAREEYEIAHRGRMHAIDALHRTEAEVDRLREALRLIVDVTMELSGRVRPPEQLDRIHEVAVDALAATSTEETKP